MFLKAKKITINVSAKENLGYYDFKTYTNGLTKIFKFRKSKEVRKYHLFLNSSEIYEDNLEIVKRVISISFRNDKVSINTFKKTARRKILQTCIGA
jgi:hypothetical protein